MIGVVLRGVPHACEREFYAYGRWSLLLFVAGNGPTNVALVANLLYACVEVGLFPCTYLMGSCNDEDLAVDVVFVKTSSGPNRLIVLF